jgi:hypothetical protein
MIERPFQHIVRIRSTDDLQYVNPDVMDEVTINANQLENDIESAAVTLWRTTLPFTVDPVLWRFQVPDWWRNAKGATKRNYARLGAWYAKGTRVPIGSVPLVDAVGDERDWRALAGNAVDYQCSRLLGVPTHLTLFEDNVPVRDLQPARIIAPALVSFTAAEDRINTVLFDAAATALGKPLAAQVILPPPRLLGPESIEDLLATIPRDGVTSYMLWTPQITEELLLGEPTIFTRVLGLVESLSSRGVPVIHQHGNYAIAALRDAGLLAMTHHLGWVDHGEPAQQTSFARRSCRTYVPGVRHSMKFERAAEAGRKLGRDDYADRYCGCPFCLGVFDELGEHPLDLLLEERQVVDKRNRTFRTPTGRAVTANTFHYLWSRHLEIRAFASDSSAEVVSRDLERAGRLLDGEDISGLRHLADLLKLA